ncbi:hypothetical protein [Flavobacterium sp.]|uniref:hypothetical protein n=1 Tax=Flavobacterium sp. TaxID=239 RepID=UPI002B4B6ABB|nr:hypothetical protein [Flavobacterium sp.]HLF51623.1 hypothetical protein [Flavobacterium sp.]
MSFLKYVQYVYLIFGAVFIYDGFSKMNAGEESPWISFILGGLAIFMFFFRRRFSKKIENRNEKK